MRAGAATDGLTVNGVAGTHVVSLGLDLAPERRAGCLGFAVQREDHTEDERVWMRGVKSFTATDPGLGPAGDASTREQPLQTFQWADYSAKPEHDYTYRVVALGGSPEQLSEGPSAAVTVRTEAELGVPHSVFFNRGSVASQEYARRFQNVPPSKLTGADRASAYTWLSRGLLEALLAFIGRARGPGFGLFGAVYEFQWPAALAALRAAADAGADVHVVFDGIKASPGNKNRVAIAAAGIGDLCAARTTGELMHNKFFVLTEQGAPVAVWTGSTNLTENGIFGHLNCGHIVEDASVARAYLDFWTELGGNPDAATEKAWMAEHNPRPPDPWDADLTVVFSPHRGQDVLGWYRDIADGAGRPAPHPPLFMTFAFGMDKRFAALFGSDDDTLRVGLMDNAGRSPAAREAVTAIQRRRNVVIAIGNRIPLNGFDRWLAEMPGLTSNIQWVHTKFMLVDPLSSTPTVITGSANFSEDSTATNNENMLVIRNDRRVADIYLGEFMRLYSHYAFREAVAIARARGEDWHPGHLAPDDSWQGDHFRAGSGRCLRRLYFAQPLS